MHIHELPVPPAVASDQKARELIRVWAGSGKQHISLATGAWKDPGACGIMLVDLARHLARAYERVHGLDPEQSLLRMRAAMDAEWSHDTDCDRIGGLHTQ